MRCPPCVLLIQHLTFAQHYLLIPLIHCLSIFQFLFATVASMFFLSSFQMFQVKTILTFKTIKETFCCICVDYHRGDKIIILYLRQMLVKLTIIAKYRQETREAKLLIVTRNSEEAKSCQILLHRLSKFLRINERLLFLKSSLEAKTTQKYFNGEVR